MRLLIGFILLCLNGGKCIKLLLTGESKLCLFNTESTVPVCWPANNRIGIFSIDYHYDKKYIYFEHEYNKFKRLSLDVEDPILDDINIHPFQSLMTVVVDWYHDMLYLVESGGRRVAKSRLLGEDAKVVIKIETISKIFTDITERDTITLYDLHVDPYQRLLFFLVLKNSRLSYICSSDLNGENVRFLTNSVFTNSSSTLRIDVGEKKLYLIEKNKLSIYDYDGNHMKTLLFPKELFEPHVFRNKFYWTDDDKDGFPSRGIAEGSVTSPDFSKIVQTKLHCPAMGMMTSFRVYDARVQRRKDRGQYVCNRDDCSDRCEVLPKTGDSCYCSSRRAIGPDGTTCLDCGLSSLTTFGMVPIIVDGKPSGRGDFPWHAIIYHRKGNDWWKAECGGTLVSPRAVLTAAHCVTEPCDNCAPPLMKTSDIMIALGKTKRLWNETENYEVRRTVKRITVHWKHKGSSTDYADDIAMVELQTDVPVSNYVKPACVDYKNNYLGQIRTNKSIKGYIAGFGNTKECITMGGVCDTRSLTLIYTTASVMNYSECFNAAQNIAPDFHIGLTSDRFCIGNGTISPVQRGDSGGGMTFVFQGLHYVYGVVSAKLIKTKGQQIKYSFGSFTNVSEHISWVKSHLPLQSWDVSNHSE